MDLPDMRSQILAVPLIQSLPEGMRNRLGMILLWIAEPRELAAGETLFAEGAQDTNQGCLLISGKAEIEKEASRLTTVEAPVLLGELQQFTADEVRTATVRIVEAGLVLFFDWPTLADMAARVFSPTETGKLKDSLAEFAADRFESLSDLLSIKHTEESLE